MIWTSKTRQRQPRGAVRVNWANPLSRALVLAVNGNDPSQNIAQNAPVIAQNGMGTRVGVGGVGLAQPSTSASGVRVDSSRLLVGSGGNFTGMTVVIVANPPNAGGWLMGLCLSAQTGTEWYVGWGAQLYGGSSAGTFNINTWAGTGVDVFGVCDGRDHVFAATFPEGAGTTASAYVDGVKTTGSVANSLPNTNSAAYVGGYWANGYAINGMSQYLTLGFNRELSAGEVVSLSKNPWQLFAPERTPVFYSIGGAPPGGGGSANRIMLLRRPGLSRIWR